MKDDAAGMTSVSLFSTPRELLFFGLGNLLCYLPIHVLTRMASTGIFNSQAGVGAGSFEMLPLYAVGNACCSCTLFTAIGWWKEVRWGRYLGLPVPSIRWYIWLSALCIVFQIMATIWAYAFPGISIVFAALLLKGGTLLFAPVSDIVGKRRRTIYWPSWAASALCFAALSLGLLERADAAITPPCLVAIGVYLAGYLVRLFIMSRWAKADDPGVRRRYVVEEQLAINMLFPAILLAMAACAPFAGAGSVFERVWFGMSGLPATGFIVPPLLIGAAAAGGGICASFIFLDRRENTFCIAAVQSAGLISGVLSTFFLAALFRFSFPSVFKLAGVALVIGATALLANRDRVERRAFLRLRQACAVEGSG